jgi:hypothetical protein
MFIPHPRDTPKKKEKKRKKKSKKQNRNILVFISHCPFIAVQCSILFTPREHSIPHHTPSLPPPTPLSEPEP